MDKKVIVSSKRLIRPYSSRPPVTFPINRNDKKLVILLAKLMIAEIAPIRVNGTATFIYRESMPQWGREIIDRCNIYGSRSLTWTMRFVHEALFAIVTFEKVESICDNCKGDVLTNDILNWLAHDIRMLDYYDKLTVKERKVEMRDQLSFMQAIHKIEVAVILTASLRRWKGDLS